MRETPETAYVNHAPLVAGSPEACRRKRAERGGFSLIEMLMAMTVTVMIVSLTVLIFKDSDAAWTAGAQRAERESAARATLQLLSRDLRQAMIYEPFNMQDLSSTNSYLFPATELRLHALLHDGSDTNRAVQEVRYFVQTNSSASDVRYELVRGVSNALGYAEGVVAANVAGFAVIAPDGSLDYSSPANSFPPFVDLYLELLDERAARRAARMIKDGSEEELLRQAEFVDRHARRYTTRVHLRNRN